MRPLILRAVFVAVTSLMLAACQAQSGNRLQHASIAAAPYQLDTGDQLRIIVFDQENISNVYTVDASGSIAMPLIGVVAVRGLTTTALERSIGAKLQNGYVRNPDVTVEIQAYRPFFILGEVRNPGQYPYVAGLSVKTAAAVAGGFTERASKRRAILTRRADGVPQRRVVKTDIPIQPGDTIEIVERLF